MNFLKFLFTIFFAFVLFGCEGRECLNDENQKAIEIIHMDLNNTNISGTWQCIFDRYEASIYGVDDNKTLEKLLKNIQIAEMTTKANVKISIYSERWEIGGKKSPPKWNPIKVIKFKK